MRTIKSQTAQILFGLPFALPKGVARIIRHENTERDAKAPLGDEGALDCKSRRGISLRPLFSKVMSLAFASSSNAAVCGYLLIPNLALMLVVIGRFLAFIPRRWKRIRPKIIAAGLHSAQAICNHHTGIGPLINKPLADVILGPVNGSSVTSSGGTSSNRYIYKIIE